MFRIIFIVLAFVLMPFRMLFLVSILLNVIFVIILHTFIVNDNYANTIKTYHLIDQSGKDLFAKSCNNRSECYLTMYTSDGDRLKEIYRQNSNNSDKNLSNITRAIEGVMVEHESANLTLSHDICKRQSQYKTICKIQDLVAVFETRNCKSCVDKFENNLSTAEKRHYKNTLLRISHDMHGKIFNFFDKKNNNFDASTLTKLKNKIKFIFD